jgi:Leucine rich repeat variant
MGLADATRTISKTWRSARALRLAVVDGRRSWRDLQPLLERAHRGTDQEELVRLAAHPSMSVRLGVASNRGVDPELLRRLASEGPGAVDGSMPSWATRAVAVLKPPVPAEVSAALGENRHNRIRASVARNPSVPSDLLAVLADDDDRGVRAGAAANPQLGTEALLRLAGDSDASVRRAAAGNRHLPTETLGTLAADADEGVRARVAGNPATPASQLLMLAEQRSAAVDLSLAGNRSVPTEVLFRLADRSEPHSGITRMVARNPGCPEELRRRLSAVQGPLPSIPRTIKQAKRARRKNWLSGIAMILGMVGGGLVAWCLALWEATRHPEDPGIAMLGLHSFALKKKALDLAADGEPDASALAEIRQMAGQRTRAARRAALWLRCDGWAEEEAVPMRARRILLAVSSGGDLEPITGTDQLRLDALTALSGLAQEGRFDALVALQPRLAIVIHGLVPLGQPRPDGLRFEPVRVGLLALSPVFGIRLVARIPILRRKIPAVMPGLLARLDALVGPACESPDPVLSSHLAVNVALTRAVDRLYEGGLSSGGGGG